MLLQENFNYYCFFRVKDLASNIVSFINIDNKSIVSNLSDFFLVEKEDFQ